MSSVDIVLVFVFFFLLFAFNNLKYYVKDLEIRIKNEAYWANNRRRAIKTELEKERQVMRTRFGNLRKRLRVLEGGEVKS